jgi:Cu/Ag efflux pump CusA
MDLPLSRVCAALLCVPLAASAAPSCIDVRGRDLEAAVGDPRAAVSKEMKLEPGMSIATRGSSSSWSAPTRG